MKSIITMQNSLRDEAQISGMIDFVRSGGFFTVDTLTEFAKSKGKKTSPLIKIARFEDGALYWHDGHHRATSIWIAGRKFLDEREYEIVDWKYSEYLEINLDQKWYTPFDPRKEVRINHILPYKAMVEDFLRKDQKPTTDEINKFIFDHYRSRSYVEPRIARTIADVANYYTSTMMLKSI